MNFHQNPSILTNVFKLQISPMRCPSISGGPKCLKYQNVPYIHNFGHIGKPWFQCWVRIIYFLTVPDDHTVAYKKYVNVCAFTVAILGYSLSLDGRRECGIRGQWPGSRLYILAGGHIGTGWRMAHIYRSTPTFISGDLKAKNRLYFSPPANPK